MYLKAIELHGFKSFPDKTKIEFEKGMSVVVGPNGSGKSNISDAIRWVLGETRSSRLRASGKMEDIIFGGTTKRNPMGFASVSLILDNSHHTFDVESDEVSVMRKYYRGGDSEYYINGARVRLRDIQELFFDTGLGKNGYSIVSQGKVSEIVTSKPEGRREIFEEASGIAKFRYKKNEAERKLESAQGNITRLSDILGELEERVGPLEKESRKAKEFIRLSSRKKELEISLWMDTVDKSKELIRTRQRRLEIFTDDYNNVSEKLAQSENYIENRYLYANSLLAKNEENVAKIRSYESEISRIASERAVLVSQRKFARQQIETLQAELGDFENQGGESQKRKQVLAEKIEQLTQLLEEKKATQTKLQSRLEELGKKARLAGDEKGRLSAQISSLAMKIQDAKIEMSSAESRMQSIAENTAAAKENLEKAKDALAQSQSRANEVKEYSDLMRENIIKNTNIKNGLVMKSNSAVQKLEAAKKRAEENLISQRQVADRVKILTDLENNMDGFSQSVKNVLKYAVQGGLGGILGSVAQIISVDKKYETAIEIALGYSMQNIVTENQSSAKRAIDYLKNSRGGRATFLPLDTVRPSVFNENLPDWAVTADSVVQADSKFKNIVSNLLGRTIIVSDIDSASSLAGKLNYRYRIVTLDGQLVNAGGSFTGGSVSKSAGIFSRKSEIESLKRKLETLKEEYKVLEKNKIDAGNVADNALSQIQGCENEINALVSDKANADIELARIEQTIQRYESQAEMLEDNLASFEQAAVEHEKRKSQLSQLIEKLSEESQLIEDNLSKLGRQDLESASEQNHLADMIQSVRLEIVAVTGDINLEKNNFAQLEATLAQRQLRKKKIIEDIENYENDISDKNQQIADFARQESDLKSQIATKEEENRSFVKQRMEIERERTKITAENKDLSSQKESISGQMAKIQERITSMETAYDEIIAKLWEEYELTVQNAREIAMVVENEGAMKRELASVKNSIKRLGNVNVGAIEEYKEVSDRYTYLKGRLEDLTESKNQLIKLITSLNGEMKTLFTESFAAINENFGRIFTELFGGGTASLELTDKEDVLSSGIEINVNPPGKVIKSLTSLSGGEQTLVAISIYFAILAHNPSPFCVLDEIEAALDDVNVTRYANYLHRICDKTQFIVITHRRGTMEAADVLYGVTMQEDGISKLLKLDVNNLSPAIIN